MGCCNEKTFRLARSCVLVVSFEEEIIKNCEQSIPFSSISIIKILETFNSYKKKILTRPQLQSLLTDLGFHHSTFSDPDSNEFKFVRHLKNAKRMFDHHRVLLCALLLASGSSLIKAQALFELFDDKKEEFLEKEIVRGMAKEIIELAVVQLPLVAVNDSEESNANFLSSSKLSEHVKRLLARQEFVVSAILQRLYENRQKINKNEFILKINQDPFLESMLWSYQIRQVLLE